MGDSKSGVLRQSMDRSPLAICWKCNEDGVTLILVYRCHRTWCEFIRGFWSTVGIHVFLAMLLCTTFGWGTALIGSFLSVIHAYRFRQVHRCVLPLLIILMLTILTIRCVECLAPAGNLQHRVWGVHITFAVYLVSAFVAYVTFADQMGRLPCLKVAEHTRGPRPEKFEASWADQGAVLSVRSKYDKLCSAQPHLVDLFCGGAILETILAEILPSGVYNSHLLRRGLKLSAEIVFPVIVLLELATGFLGSVLKHLVWLKLLIEKDRLLSLLGSWLWTLYREICSWTVVQAIAAYIGRLLSVWEYFVNLYERLEVWIIKLNFVLSKLRVTYFLSTLARIIARVHRAIVWFARVPVKLLHRIQQLTTTIARTLRSICFEWRRLRGHNRRPQHPSNIKPASSKTVRQ